MGDIGAIINKYIEDEEIQKNNLKDHIISEETKAMQLFFERKSPIEVRIELNVRTVESRKVLQGLLEINRTLSTSHIL